MEDILDIQWQRRLKLRQEHLEAFAARYLTMTNIPADEALLVEEIKDNKVQWYFTRRK